MDLNRENYEAFLLDYLEGRLDARQKKQADDFLAENPDIAVSFRLLQEAWGKDGSALELPAADPLPFPEKEKLLDIARPAPKTYRRFRTAFLPGAFRVWGPAAALAACLLLFLLFRPESEIPAPDLSANRFYGENRPEAENSLISNAYTENQKDESIPMVSGSKNGRNAGEQSRQAASDAGQNLQQTTLSRKAISPQKPGNDLDNQEETDAPEKADNRIGSNPGNRNRNGSGLHEPDGLDNKKNPDIPAVVPQNGNILPRQAAPTPEPVRPEKLLYKVKPLTRPELYLAQDLLPKTNPESPSGNGTGDGNSNEAGNLFHSFFAQLFQSWSQPVREDVATFRQDFTALKKTKKRKPSASVQYQAYWEGESEF